MLCTTNQFVRACQSLCLLRNFFYAIRFILKKSFNTFVMKNLFRFSAPVFVFNLVAVAIRSAP